MTRSYPVAPAPATFEEAVDWSLASLQLIRKVLSTFFTALTDDEREHLPPIPDDFSEAADAMLAQKELLARFSGVCKGFDPAKVRADVQAATAAGPLLAELENLTRLVSDGQRSRLTRAYTAILPVYNTARDLAETDSDYQPLVRPLAKIYAVRVATRKANAKAKAEAAPTAAAPEADES